MLFATVLFAIRTRVQEWLRTQGSHAHRTRGWLAMALVAAFLVAIYGGYFGAGMSIMMLSMLGMVGMTDLLEMNALTSLFSLCVNGVAIALFIAAKLVYWPFVLVMAVGALLGGYGAAGVARKIGRQHLSRFVIVVGFTVTIVFFLRKFG